MFQVKQSSPLGVSGVSCVARLQRDRVAVKSVHTCRRAAGGGSHHLLNEERLETRIGTSCSGHGIFFKTLHSIAMHWKSLEVVKHTNDAHDIPIT